MLTEAASWPWPDELDGVLVAPDSHRLLFENDRVRVLEVLIPAGQREPEHTHRWPSVMTVADAARIRYYEGDTLRFESPADSVSGPHPPHWLEPEGPHAVENIDDHAYRAYRVELKPL